MLLLVWYEIIGTHLWLKVWLGVGAEITWLELGKDRNFKEAGPS